MISLFYYAVKSPSENSKEIIRSFQGGLAMLLWVLGFMIWMTTMIFMGFVVFVTGIWRFFIRK